LAAQETAHADHRIIFEQLARSYEAKAKDIEWLHAPPRGTPDDDVR